MAEVTTCPTLTIRDVRATAVEVPMTFALGTSRAVVTKAPLLLIDLETHEGFTGRAYLFCYLRGAAPAIATIVAELARLSAGAPVAPLRLWDSFAKQLALIGVHGIVRMAMSGFDVACWDALAQAAGLPLSRLLGAEPRPIPAYNSCGLGLMATDRLADEAERLMTRGFTAVKLRLGHATLREDLAAVRAVRHRLGGDATIMVDYNQALTVAEALARGRALDQEGVYWIEEPIRHDDFEGAARLAHALATPVQIGENFSEASSMAAAIAAGAADYVMPDLDRIGGVTGWQRAAALAAVHRIEMSSHLFPEVSAHLLAATPTCHWLEWVDWAEAILEQPLKIVDGRAMPSDRPGNGLSWNARAVEKYRM